MLNKLQEKWKVGTVRLFLIITTFAVGGSLCGYACRKLLGLTTIDEGFLWVILYILIVTILWPISVLLVSIPLRQFSFFKRYLHKMFKRITGGKISSNDNKTNNANEHSHICQWWRQ